MNATVAFAEVAFRHGGLAALAGCSTAGEHDCVRLATGIAIDIQSNSPRRADRAQSVTCHEDLIGRSAGPLGCDVMMSVAKRLPAHRHRQPCPTAAPSNYEMTRRSRRSNWRRRRPSHRPQNSGYRVDSVACESGLEAGSTRQRTATVDAGGSKAAARAGTEVSGLMMDFI